MRDEKKQRRRLVAGNESGQTLTEYILVVVLIVVGFIVVLSFVGFQEILDAAVAYIKSKLPGGP